MRMEEKNECNTCSTEPEGEACSACGAGGDAKAAVDPTFAAVKARMKNVKHKIAIMSGKGGVGKTTVSVNLALALANKGYKVGLLDADVTAPNVAKMLGISNPELFATPAGLFPPEAKGVKVISMAFLVDENQAIIWRGPVIMGVIEQFLSDIVWGELDYLLIDLPPGTGDEALSVMQLIPDLDGIITVTTPQEVAVLDTRRSIDMAKVMRVPVIGVIENMSSFVCPHCGEVTQIFRSGGGEKVAKELGVPLLGSIPIDPRIAEAGDSGEPFIANHEGPAKKAFEAIVEKIEETVKKRAEEKERELSSLFKE